MMNHEVHVTVMHNALHAKRKVSPQLTHSTRCQLGIWIGVVRQDAPRMKPILTKCMRAIPMGLSNLYNSLSQHRERSLDQGCELGMLRTDIYIHIYI